MRGNLWILLVFLAGCAGDVTAILVQIETTAEVSEMDQMLLTIQAATPEGETCVTAPLLLDVDDESDFPLVVEVDRGSVFTAHAMFVVRAYLDGEPVSEPRMGWEGWTDGETTTKTLTLDAECFDLADPCGEGEHCMQGRCLEPNLPLEYGDPASLDESLYCHHALNTL